VPIVAIPLATPFILLILHAVMQRLMRGSPPQRVAFLVCALGVVPVGAAVFLAGVHDLGSLVYVGLAFPCIAYSYFHLFNLSETARRIRLIREIDRCGGMTEEEIRRAYTEDDVVDIRLARMSAMGHLVERDGRYFGGSPILLFAARVLDGWRNVLGYDRGARKGTDDA
jgi:hypothetical protein